MIFATGTRRGHGASNRCRLRVRRERGRWLRARRGRSNDANMWRIDESAALKFLLDEVYPVTGLGVQSVLGGGVVVGAPVDRRRRRRNDAARCTVRRRRRRAGLLLGRERPRLELGPCVVARRPYRSSHAQVPVPHERVRDAPESATDAIERYRSRLRGASALRAVAGGACDADGEAGRRRCCNVGSAKRASRRLLPPLGPPAKTSLLMTLCSRSDHRTPRARTTSTPMVRLSAALVLALRPYVRIEAASRR